MTKLLHKVAIITGGGQGLGFGIARAFADEGAKLVLTGRYQDKLDGKADQLRAQGAEVLTIAGDVCERGTADRVVAATLDKFGRVDILVNNAQAIYPNLPFKDQEDEQIESTVRSGLFGTIYFMQAAYPALGKQGGAIINMGSLEGTQGGIGFASYSATKEGIRAVSRVAAREWGRENIRVNVICPGAMSETGLAYFAKYPEKRPIYESRLALGRYAEPYEDIGRLAAFLAGPDCFLTGQTLNSDGGQIMP